MASTARSCNEAAPPDTLDVVRLQRLRLRRAAAGCLDPIAEESSAGSDDDVPSDSPSAHSSSVRATASAFASVTSSPRRCALG